MDATDKTNYNNSKSKNRILSEQIIERLDAHSDIIMTLIGFAGILSMTVIAPQAETVVDLFHNRKKGKPLSKKERKKKATQTFYYLKRQNYIEFKKKGEEVEIFITQKGRKKLKTIKQKIKTLPVENTWDGKFWLIAADIPTKFKNEADRFRRKIRKLNVYPLQRTMWFYPYDPRGEISLLAKELGIASFVTTMKVSHIERSDQEDLEKYFKKIELI